MLSSECEAALLSQQRSRVVETGNFAGGIDIEENWERVKTVTVPTAGDATGDALAPLLGGLPLELRPAIENFIQAAFTVRAARSRAPELETYCGRCPLSARRVQTFPRRFCKAAAVRCRCQLGHSLSALLRITLVAIPAMFPFVPLRLHPQQQDQACTNSCTEEQPVPADRCSVSCRQRSEWVHHGPGRMSRIAFARRLAGVQRAGLLPHGNESGEHCCQTPSCTSSFPASAQWCS